MFNSFGNLAIDPETALLFLDFTSGRTLQLTGAAEIEWGEPAPATMGTRPAHPLHAPATRRRPAAAARQTAHSSYPRNPDLTG